MRFVKGGPGSAYGGNVEVKIVDPSANPYLASAAILGLALDGIERQGRAAARNDDRSRRQLSDSERDRAGILRLPEAQPEVIAALDDSALLRGHAGRSRRSTWWSRSGVEEHERYGDLEPEELADKFRMAWSL